MNGNNVLSVSEQLKRKLIADGYTDGKVIGSGCTMVGNPIRDIHFNAKGKKLPTQKIINNYMKQIDNDFCCGLKIHEDGTFSIYVQLKDEFYKKAEKLLSDEVDAKPCDEDCVPDVALKSRIVEIMVHKNCLVDTIGNLSLHTRIRNIHIIEFSANFYEINYEFLEEE